MGELASQTQEVFEVTHCCKCNVQIALPRRVMRDFRDNHDTFYCFQGHGQQFVGPTEAERLKAELAREKSRHEWTRKLKDDAQKSASAYKGKVTAIKNRIANGVCPCCRRSFQNLQRHMSGQHPEWKEETDQ